MFFKKTKKKNSEPQKNVPEEQPKNIDTTPTPVQESDKMHIEEETVPLKNEEDMDEEELLKRAKELSLQDPANIAQEQVKPQPSEEKSFFFLIIL